MLATARAVSFSGIRCTLEVKTPFIQEGHSFHVILKIQKHG